ncbi:hypothetical protein WOLCODRAFT_15210 [Wolfiporia cocos MD-104 SS10]|uniref:HAT C-terminal dimerisation domain-containing protein n=1 Tax=Wolfiporia cocos (strain MD-104) TaxID=742152 RepID=A0A2H3J680_WOLCO|nr:hypothetical protein WOLCODRAFT_15210 [Wolfiporia cocos MD-104 SS10]
MPVRWNMTYAEIECSIKLHPAINHWIEQLDKNLTGQKKAAATRKKKKWFLSPADWELLKNICEVLEPFQKVTLVFSKSRVPTICLVLLMYKFIESHLKESKQKAGDQSLNNLANAIECSLKRLNIHLRKALVSSFPLIGAVLHPFIRLTYFQNDMLWSTDIAQRAQAILEKLFLEYASAGSAATQLTSSSQASQVEAKSVFTTAIGRATPSAQALKSELEVYFSGMYPCEDEDGALIWWKVSESHLNSAYICLNIL